MIDKNADTFLAIVFQELEFQTGKRKCKLKNELSQNVGTTPVQKHPLGCYVANDHTFSSSLHLVCQL